MVSEAQAYEEIDLPMLNRFEKQLLRRDESVFIRAADLQGPQELGEIIKSPVFFHEAGVVGVIITNSFDKHVQSFKSFQVVKSSQFRTRIELER